MNSANERDCADPLVPVLAKDPEMVKEKIDSGNHSKTRGTIKKLLKVLALMVLITMVILVTNRNPKIEEQIKMLESRVAELESKEAYLRSDININVDNYYDEEGSGEVEITDDEDFDKFELKNSIVRKMLGTWKQVELVNMEAYLEKEGASIVYQKLAKFFPPTMIFFENEPGKFVQAFQMKLAGYYHEFPFNLDGTKISFINHEDTKCIARARDEGDQISIVAEGGMNGPLLTWLYFDEQGRIVMKTTLPDLDNITAKRIFEFVSDSTEH